MRSRTHPVIAVTARKPSSRAMSMRSVRTDCCRPEMRAAHVIRARASSSTSAASPSDESASPNAGSNASLGVEGEG